MIIMIGAFGALLIFSNKEGELNKIFFKPPVCPNKLTKGQAWDDYTYFKQNDGLMHCWCLKKAIDDPRGFSKVTFTDIDP